MTKASDSIAIRPELTGFAESRIYAQGWNAARGPKKSAHNPHAHEPERARWFLGYKAGQA